MAKRFYVCRIIGDGTPFGGSGPYRAAIEDVVDPQTGFQAFSLNTIISSDPNTGEPLLPWCLVIADGARHSLVNGNPDIDPLPVFALDAKVSSMHTPTRNAMGAAMQARGINTAFVGTADGYRDVINGLGRLHNPTFDVADFDVEA